MAFLVYKTGAIGTDTNTNIIMLYGFSSNGTTNVTHLQTAFSTTGYQVTSGKTLYMVKFVVSGTTNPSWLKMGYADNDVGIDSTTARTNGVMAFGKDDANNNGLFVTPVIGGSGSYAPNDWSPFMFPIGASGKYPFIRRIGAALVESYFVWATEL